LGIHWSAKHGAKSVTIAPMTTTPVETEADVRVRQTRILQAFASRLAQGDQLLPADLVRRLGDELEERIDDEAISSAWTDQGERSPTGWRGETARASRRARGRETREVWILERAQKNLEALDDEKREEISVEVDVLAFDPLPRGSEALHGRKDDHMCLHIGEHRLLYKMQTNSIVVVALTSY